MSPHFLKWSGRRDSNSRPSPWQGDALPLSHFRIFGRGRWIRTIESSANGFTVRPLWPLGNPSKLFWSWWRESNPQPADYKSAALPLSHTSIKYLKKLATWNGLEPSTSSVTGWHSNQLNYQAIFNGGRNRARTYDPLLVRQVLSQLSYTPSHPLTTRVPFYYTQVRPECQVFFHNFFKFFRSRFRFLSFSREHYLY